MEKKYCPNCNNVIKIFASYCVTCIVSNRSLFHQNRLTDKLNKGKAALIGFGILTFKDDSCNIHYRLDHLLRNVPTTSVDSALLSYDILRGLPITDPRLLIKAFRPSDVNLDTLTTDPAVELRLVETNHNFNETRFKLVDSDTIVNAISRAHEMAK